MILSRLEISVTVFISLQHDLRDENYWRKKKSDTVVWVAVVIPEESTRWKKHGHDRLFWHGELVW